MAGIGSMHKQKLGDMRHRITVQTAVETVDASRQRVVTYTDRLTREPATFQQVTGGEYNRGRQVESGVTAIFKVNRRSGYTTKDRIVYSGEKYGVVRVENPDGIERFTYLHCKAAPVG
jgi:SPP1 family predicted phage head-tail adaptor